MSSRIIETERAGGRRVAQVLLESSLPQLDHLFDYEIPESLADVVMVGQRVRVPFRSRDRKSFGYIIGFAGSSDFHGELAPIADVVTPIPLLTPDVWRLARAVADRAGGSACDIIRLGIPLRQVRVEKRHLNGIEEDAPDVAPAAVQEEDREVAQLLTAGSRLAQTISHGPVRLETGEWLGQWAEKIAQVALAVYAESRSVVIVVPDYRALDQVHDALAAHGHQGTVRVDSRQSNAERYANFLRSLDTAPRIVLGNRSAIYAPAYSLGAILIWDDGDPVLSEPLAPYVHARDAALVRAEQSGAGLLFASHSRSAEVHRLVHMGYVRGQEHPPRRTKIIHADSALAPDAFGGRVPEYAARTIREALARGPVLVQVATPGYAPIAVCTACDELARCRACSGPIGFRTAQSGACRWCGESAAAWECANCGARELERRGTGSRRTAEQFEQQFTGARVILSDGDHPRERVDARPALVVATRGAEPIAAGGYRAVVMLDAERLLGLETLRAGEDCLRWWENAAALAAPDGVCVMASGGGPVVRAFVTGRTEEWLTTELMDRQALRYPPVVRVASLTGGKSEVERALRTLEGIRGVDHLGPAPFTPRDTDARARTSLVRAIVRFEYAQGAEVAKRLRGALVADAAGATSASRRAGRAPGQLREEALRLRFDDRGVFDG